MCGIVGIIGKQEAEKKIIEGLYRLEYRGYDSAGLFVGNLNEHDCVKAVGPIKNLEEKITTKQTGTLGIGHTRWATHGKPTLENAHPHHSLNEQFYLVHNGVIENFQTLKNEYLAEVTCYGQTDTEIIAHLIAHFYENEQLSTLEAFKKTVQLLEGSYAIALVDCQQMDTLFVAKNRCPLLIGQAEGYQMVASDLLGFSEDVETFYELNDGEIGFLKQEESMIKDCLGQNVTHQPTKLTKAWLDIDKGPYEHYMLKEIHEQPQVLRRIIQEYRTNDGELIFSEALLADLQHSDRIYIIACGTSANAGLVAKPLFEKLCQLPVEVQIASEFAYQEPLLSERPFFIFLTQSGETADIRLALNNVVRPQDPTLTITNVAHSSLARAAKHLLLLHAGAEIAVASTKAYTAQICVLALLAEKLGKLKQIEAAQSIDFIQEISVAANAMEIALEKEKELQQQIVPFLKDQEHAFYLGRNLDYYVSLEAALKLKEVSYIHVEGFAAGELKHGTLALIEEGTAVIAFITDQATAAATRNNLEEVKSRGGKLFNIALESNVQPDDSFALPNVHPLLTPLLTVIPAQLIAYYVALDKKLNVDQPRNLAKSVTVE